jgi:pimeloyl-ACP methyl ester carboxylesterase
MATDRSLIGKSGGPPVGDEGLKNKKMRNRGHGKYWLTGAVAAILIVVLAVLAPAAKVYLQAVAILLESNGDSLPRVLSSVLDKNILEKSVTIPSPDGPIKGILYTPAGSPNAPGMVIVSGLDPGGIAGLSGYARLEASTGLRVLTPDIPQLDTYSVNGLDNSAVQRIGESARWLAARTGHAVGLMGISFSGGLVLTTAARPKYAPSVKMVFDVGGYDDLSRVVNFYMTGIDRGPNGENTRVQPSFWVQDFLQYTDLMVLGSQQDITALGPILKARIFDQQHHPKGEDKVIAEMIDKLSPEEGRKLTALLDEKNNRLEFSRLIERSRQQMQDVSPHGHLSGITADVYILHGLMDDVIPSEEALWLQRDLPPGRLKKMLISPLISHVNIKGHSVTWKDKWALVYFMYRVHRAAQAA